MKTKTPEHIQLYIANAFKSQLARRFDLSELLTATFTPHKRDQNRIVAECDVAPRGQLSGIVNKLSASVSIMFGEENDSHVLIHSGELHYSYKHQSGGSNGSGTRYRVISQWDFSREEHSYIGCVEDYLAYAMQRDVAERIKTLEQQPVTA